MVRRASVAGVPLPQSDGTIAVGVDVDGDGVVDYVLAVEDRNCDGEADLLQTNSSIMPDECAPGMASVGLDLNGDGVIDTVFTGVDRDGDGIPDILQLYKSCMDLPSSLTSEKVAYDLTPALQRDLDTLFAEYDIDEGGYIDTLAELSILANYTCYLAYGAPHELKVGSLEINEFLSLGSDLLAYGMNVHLYTNLAVYCFRFPLADGSVAELIPNIRALIPHQEKKIPIPYGDPKLEGFVEWWEDLYGEEYLNKHPGDGPNGHDEVTEKILKKAKKEFIARQVRWRWEMKRDANMTKWRRCIRENLDVADCQAEEDHVVDEIRKAKIVEKLANKERKMIGQNLLWLKGASCINDDTLLFQLCSKLRAEPHWQWFMLLINMINVFGLMSSDTSCDPGDCDSAYQDSILPVLDMAANVLFTFDMLVAMIVLGFASYFDDKLLIVDFVVVVTGWFDVADMGFDFSALRALRVLRPLRLVKYFQGIQAIIGAIYFNLEPIFNVIQFMLFFLIIFGIAGITLFSGKLQHRCVVTAPYGSQTAGITYDNEYADVGEVGEMGEFEYFCTGSDERESFPFPYRCPSYMTCDPKFGNPHHGITSFDNFGSAFLLMFQTQTLSTWYEFDYFTEMTVGWYATFYYEMVVLLVGFIVSQLFIAVVCFGFDSLSETMNQPIFSDFVAGRPYVEKETDPEDNLCRCLNPPVEPLYGAKEVELDRGTLDGIRVHVNFKYHYYPPWPLDVIGGYAEKESSDDDESEEDLNSALEAAIQAEEDSMALSSSAPAMLKGDNKSHRRTSVSAPSHQRKRSRRTSVGYETQSPEVQKSDNQQLKTDLEADGLSLPQNRLNAGDSKQLATSLEADRNNKQMEIVYEPQKLAAPADNMQDDNLAIQQAAEIAELEAALLAADDDKQQLQTGLSDLEQMDLGHESEEDLATQHRTKTDLSMDLETELAYHTANSPTIGTVAPGDESQEDLLPGAASSNEEASKDWWEAQERDIHAGLPELKSVNSSTEPSSGTGAGTGGSSVHPSSEKARAYPKTEEQLYWEYRDLMHKWKSKEQTIIDAKEAAPNPTAQGTLRPRDLQFEYDDLVTWSNERVFSLHKKLRAQEGIDDTNTIEFFHDVCGAPGYEMKNELLADLVNANDTDVPDLTVHVRCFIKVVVEPLSNPNCNLPQFSLIGSETIGEVKAMCFEHLSNEFDTQGNPAMPSTIKLEDCQLHVDGDTFTADSLSVFAVCDTFFEGHFDPMRDTAFFALTIDKRETFILSSQFDTAIMILIGVNTVFMSIEHYGSSDTYNTILKWAEWFFNAGYTFEFIIKVVFLKGFGNYIRIGSNQFDLIIVVSAWINFFFEATGLNLTFVRVFRLLRALRVTRLLRKFESVKKIIDATFNSLQPVMNIMLFMMVVLTVYSCLGMQLYGNQFNEFDELPRENFDNFVMAFLGLFQVLTGSAWELVLYDCMRASKNAAAGVPFILSFFILCNYIIMNLFIGAILSNMSNGTDEERLEITIEKQARDQLRQEMARESQLFVNNCLSHAKAEGRMDQPLTNMKQVMQQRGSKDTFITSPIEGTRFGIKINNVAMCCFPPSSCFRRSVYRMVNNWYFELFILLVIIYSTILLTLMNPDTLRDDTWTAFFAGNDVFFLIIFTGEFILKIIAFGFVWCDNIEFMLDNEKDLKEMMLGDHGIPSYMYDTWNYLDVMVLTVSWVNMFVPPEGPLKVLRLARAFRPLRMVNRIDGMKLVIMSLVAAGPALGNVMAFLIFAVFLIFGILGLSLFMGKFQSCNDVVDEFIGGSNKANCYGHETEAGDYWTPKVFQNPGLDGYGSCSFDNMWEGFMTLFEVSSGDSWETVMYLMADVPNKLDEAPYRDDGPLSNCLWAFFCVIFVFVGQLFTMQLFVSVIIDSFSLAEGSGLLTAEQALMLDMRRYFREQSPEPKPKVPESWWRNCFYSFFVEARPLPVPEMQQCIQAKRLPNNRFIANAQVVRRQVDITRQSVAMQKDPAEADKLTKKVEFLQDVYKTKLADIELLECFSQAALQQQPLPPGCLYVCGSWFDTVLTTCIIVNVCLMCTVHHGQPDSWTYFLWVQNMAFLVVFTCEMSIKVIGLGCKPYWYSPFDAFDGFTVCVGWVFVFFDMGPVGGIFRIGRVFRLVKRAPKLQNLMSTLIHTIPSVSNVFMVLLLVLFVYSVIGVELFGKTRYGAQLNVVANMGTWSAAMHVLWRAALGNWRGIMYDTMVMAPDCTKTIDAESRYCPGVCIHDLYVWKVITALMVLNLIVGIIINAFTWCYSLEPSEITSGLVVNSEHLLHYKEIWSRFDLAQSGFVDLKDLQFLMSVLQFNIPELLRTGKVDQQGVFVIMDYSSFGSGPEGKDRHGTEAECRANYETLVDRITKYERALEVTDRINQDGVDIQAGENTFIFSASIDNGIILAEENSELAQLFKVRYATLIMILLMDANELTEHDQYVCHEYRHPFKYSVNGYSTADICRHTEIGQISRSNSVDARRKSVSGTEQWQDKHRTNMDMAGIVQSMDTFG